MFWYTLHYFMNERQVKYGRHYLKQDTPEVFIGQVFSSSTTEGLLYNQVF